MSKKLKLTQRLLQKPKDFTYDEAKSLLTGFGFTEYSKGKTSGSRVSFYHAETKKVFDLHKPHPNKELKSYVVEALITFLMEAGFINE